MDNIKVKGSTEDVAVDIATDEVGSRHFPVYKQAFSVEGVEPVHVSATNPLPITTTSASPLTTNDFLLEVGKGNITGHSFLLVRGHNPAVGTAFEDLSDVGVLSTLAYDAQSANFTAGDILTGGTSAATATIVIDDDDGGTGTLTIRDIVGIFVNDETITDVSGGSATSNGVISSLGAVVLPSAGTQWEIIAESANDTSAGTGARTVTLVYLDANYAVQSEVITLSGNTPVLTTATDILRFTSLSVATWGSATNNAFGKTNLGSIVARDSSGNVQGAIRYNDTVLGDEHGLNISRHSISTIPAGFSGQLLQILTNTSKNHEAETLLMVRSFGTDGFLSVAGQDAYQNSFIVDVKAARPLVEKTDIRVISRSNNTAVPVTVSYDILLVAD